MYMRQTEMKIRERKGFSVHNAILEVRGEDAHADKLIIHGPTGCEYWDDESDFCTLYRPSAERWIPVTERLPKEEGQYLVCCNGNYPIEVGGFYIDEDGERYFGCDWNDPDDIEAWMPLPEPYKRR